MSLKEKSCPTLAADLHTQTTGCADSAPQHKRHCMMPKVCKYEEGGVKTAPHGLPSEQQAKSTQTFCIPKSGPIPGQGI